jgi:SpoVK/Ycf46/Vps4 family AAA+-type ATPase
LNRFRTTIYMGAPSREEMIQMYQLYFKQKGLQLPDDLDWDKIVKESKGFTGRVIEQTTMNLQEMMLKRDMELAKALDQEIRKKGPKALDGAELSFTQADLLEAIAKTRKPKRIKGDYDLAS